MYDEEIRWVQRFNNFCKALDQLTKFINKGELNELEKQGLIQAFEYNFELAWSTIKDFYEDQGEVDIQGSRDAFRLAFKRGLVYDGEVWMDMIGSRNKTSHTYNESVAASIVDDITNRYFLEFVALRNKFSERVNRELG